MRDEVKTILRKLPKISDDRLVCREWYNPGKYPIEFTRQFDWDQRIIGSGISLGPAKFILKPDEFAFVSHAFYVGKCLGGQPTIEIITNYGRAIGIGNKLPSAPIPELSNGNL